MRRRKGPEDFWRRVLIGEVGDCWPWTGATLTPYPYGATKYQGRQWKAHRLAYLLHNGTLVPGLHVMHRCDNPICCNPAHLSQGTSQNNVDDMVQKGRHARGETHAWACHPEITPRGEQIASGKLKTAEVQAIRRAHEGGRAIRALAREYNVSPPAIRMIVRRKTWKHVE